MRARSYRGAPSGKAGALSSVLAGALLLMTSVTPASALSTLTAPRPSGRPLAARSNRSGSCTNSTPQSQLQAFVDSYTPGEWDSRGIGIVLYNAVQNDPANVQLATFEAALVESNMHNEPYGDCDSLGVFQQRPSMGWCNPETDCLDVRHAVQSFRSRAANYASAHPNADAGTIAQAVQGSKYPDRYQARAGDAQRELDLSRHDYLMMSGSGGVTGSPVNGFWSVQPDGTVHSYAGAQWFGDMHGQPLQKPVVGITATSTGLGYWLVAADGGVFAFGDAAVLREHGRSAVTEAGGRDGSDAVGSRLLVGCGRRWGLCVR